MLAVYGLYIGLESYFMVTQFPKKWRPKGIEKKSLYLMHIFIKNILIRWVDKWEDECKSGFKDF